VRQLKWEMGKDCLVIHLTLIPFLSTTGELKTKPTQHSVKALLELGLQPDILVCRTEHYLSDEIKSKIAKFCNVAANSVVESIDAETIYDVPLLMQEQKLDEVVLEKLNLPITGNTNLENWNEFLTKYKNPKKTINIGLIGKYIELKDSYKSIVEAFIHAGAANECKIKIMWLHSEKISEKNVSIKLDGLKGILVAPGFGERGIEGKIAAIKYARENKLPFLGICLGMQCAVIEFARNVLGLEGAHSTEVNPKTSFPVIDKMNTQKGITNKGGTMRLGAYPCKLKKGSKIFDVYGKEMISERHRHRYEFNNQYLEQFEEAGMKATGINPENGLVEIIEIPDHPWFIGVQFHPEYKSTVAQPHPLFIEFIKAAVGVKELVN
jgi:CTP synthase